MGDGGTSTAQKDRRNSDTGTRREGVDHRERRSRSQRQAHNTMPDPNTDATPCQAMSPGPNARLWTSRAPEEQEEGQSRNSEAPELHGGANARPWGRAGHARASIDCRGQAADAREKRRRPQHRSPSASHRGAPRRSAKDADVAGRKQQRRRG
jgi:hypothetical protein